MIHSNDPNYEPYKWDHLLSYTKTTQKEKDRLERIEKSLERIEKEIYKLTRLEIIMNKKQAIKILEKIEESFLNCHYPLEHVMFFNNDKPSEYTVGEMYKQALETLKEEKIPMKFNEYQKLAKETAIYPIDSEIIYPTLGLNGEAGEVAEKVKKVIRDGGSFADPSVILEIVKELGDVLWYLSDIAEGLGVELEQVAVLNLEKLKRRKRRNMLNGNGDNR
jgi:NTP pyrophosphatase (non-canonical NTP hydrolase)